MDTPKPRDLRQKPTQYTRLWFFRKAFNQFFRIGKPSVVRLEIQHAAVRVGVLTIPHETTTQVHHEEGQVHGVRDSGFFDDHEVLQAPVRVSRLSNGRESRHAIKPKDLNCVPAAIEALVRSSNLSERVGFRASQSHIPKKPIWLCDALFTVLSDKLLAMADTQFRSATAL